MIIVLLWHLWTVHVKKLLTIGSWNCPMTKKLFLVCIHEPEVTELDVWFKIKPANRKIHRQNAVTWHLECQIPLINCYLISFLSTSFRSAVVVCLITYANSVSLKILVNRCTQGRRWTRTVMEVLIKSGLSGRRFANEDVLHRWVGKWCI